MSWESEPVKARSPTTVPVGPARNQWKLPLLVRPSKTRRAAGGGGEGWGGCAAGSGWGRRREPGPPKSRKKITLLKGSRRRHWALPAPLRAVTSKKSRSPAAPANWKRSVSLAGARVPEAGGAGGGGGAGGVADAVHGEGVGAGGEGQRRVASADVVGVGAGEGAVADDRPGGAGQEPAEVAVVGEAVADETGGGGGGGGVGG